MVYYSFLLCQTFLAIRMISLLVLFLIRKRHFLRSSARIVYLRSSPFILPLLRRHIVVLLIRENQHFENDCPEQVLPHRLQRFQKIHSFNSLNRWSRLFCHRTKRGHSDLFFFLRQPLRIHFFFCDMKIPPFSSEQDLERSKWWEHPIRHFLICVSHIVSGIE